MTQYGKYEGNSPSRIVQTSWSAMSFAVWCRVCQPRCVCDSVVVSSIRRVVDRSRVGRCAALPGHRQQPRGVPRRVCQPIGVFIDGRSLSGYQRVSLHRFLDGLISPTLSDQS